MPFEDKNLPCTDCEQDFVHSAADQARYAERGFTNEPKRCPSCREKRRANSGGGGGGGGRRGGGGGGGGGGGDSDRGSRESFDVVCAECGTQTTVPFKPSQGRPVLCRDCFRAKRR